MLLRIDFFFPTRGAIQHCNRCRVSAMAKKLMTQFKDILGAHTSTGLVASRCVDAVVVVVAGLHGSLVIFFRILSVCLLSFLCGDQRTKLKFGAII